MVALALLFILVILNPRDDTVPLQKKSNLELPRIENGDIKVENSQLETSASQISNGQFAQTTQGFQDMQGSLNPQNLAGSQDLQAGQAVLQPNP